MSMALLAGFIVAYRINWWLVAKGLKHTMSTAGDHSLDRGASKAAMEHPAPSTQPSASMRKIVLMAALSTFVFDLVYVGVGVVRANMETRSSTPIGQPGGAAA
jgi:hypothetical protein